MKDFKNFLNENKVEDEIVSFLNKQMKKDKKEYEGDIPTEYNSGSDWDDRSWYVDEILNFLRNNYGSSYLLINFWKKYKYETIHKILKKNFEREYRYSKKILNE